MSFASQRDYVLAGKLHFSKDSFSLIAKTLSKDPSYY